MWALNTPQLIGLPSPECSLHTEQLKMRSYTPSVGFRTALDLIPAWSISPTLQQGKMSLREGNSWPGAKPGLEPEDGHPAAFPGSLVLAPSCVTLANLFSSPFLSFPLCNMLTVTFLPRS